MLDLVGIAMLSALLFNEEMPALKIAGLLTVVAGMLVQNLEKDPQATGTKAPSNEHL